MSLRLSLGILLGFLLSAPAFADEAAALVFFSGNPLLTAESGAVRPLRKGDSVASGETIDTVDGRVQLRFRDGASMSLQPGTQFRVDSYRYSGNGAQAAAGDGVIMSLIKGSLRTVTGWLGKQDRKQYRIGTTVATIGIRGTEFGASMDGSGLTVTTYVGLVEVCSEVGCVDVAPAETVWVRSPGVKPELRSGLESGGLKTEGMMPATPVNREAMPLQQPTQPVQPMPNAAPPYNMPPMHSPPTSP
ncbi:MAG: FecR family protein [Azonexus sp.]|nr:FecR family protein [Azonexus sp.]